MSDSSSDRLNAARRERNEAIQNYAVYHLKIDPRNAHGTVRDITPEHVMHEIGTRRDTCADTATDYLAAGLLTARAEIATLNGQVRALKGAVVAVGGLAALASLATLVVLLTR